MTMAVDLDFDRLEEAIAARTTESTVTRRFTRLKTEDPTPTPSISEKPTRRMPRFVLVSK